MVFARFPPSPDPTVTAHAFADDRAEAASYKVFFSTMRGVQLAALAMAATLVILSYGHVPGPLLGGWSALAVADLLWRRRVGRHYARLVRFSNLQQQIAYARRQDVVWIINAVFWGLTPLVLCSFLPQSHALIAWMLVVAGGISRAAYLAHNLRSAKRYLWVYGFCLAVSVCVELVRGAYGEAGPERWWMPVGLAAYLIMLFRIVCASYARNLQNIDLLHQNQHLIESLREQTRAAQAAAEFRTRFLAGAAHDLKQPISALGIYAEWLAAEPRVVEELAPKILHATQAVNTLFDSLIDLAKLDVEHLRVNLKAVDLAPLLEDLLVQYRPLAVQKGLKLRIRPAQAHFVTDPIVLRRILGNLISNAIRYSSIGGVLVAVRQRPGMLVFEVWDTGIGIPTDQHARIFGEFYKVRQGGGTEDGFGLGLALVKRLTVLMGYTITLRSRLARGTLFRIQVPLSSITTAQLSPPELTGSASHDDARSEASVSAT